MRISGDGIKSGHGGDLPVAVLVGASVGLDAVKAARRALLAGDLNGVYAELRRSFEMQMLAWAAYFRPTLGEQWLAGAQIEQKALRNVVAEEQPEADMALDRLYWLLSDQAHGRVQSLAVRTNPWGGFSWPPKASTMDPLIVEVVFAALSEFGRNFANLEERITDNWTRTADLQLSRLGRERYSRLVSYYSQRDRARGHQGTHWLHLEPSEAAEWLGTPARPVDDPNPALS